MQRMTAALGLALAFAALMASAASADPYYNSSEPGCDGRDSRVLFCEGFESGTWYVTNGDTSGGPLNPQNKGWAGTIYSAINPPGAAKCGTGLTPFGNCAGFGGSGTRTSSGGNMAMHRLKTPTCGSGGWELCGVNEIYVRWYTKWDAGYLWGNEKHMNITNSDGDIAFADITLGAGRCGSGSSSPTSDIGIAVNYGTINDGGACGPQNQGNNITLQSGHWYFFEFHVKAGSSAVVELWVNDCGPSGTTCGPAPILRTRYTGNLPGNSKGSQIQTVWLENWTGVTSSGSGPYWDQIKASTVGPIGFSGSSGSVDRVAPGAPASPALR
jgi:hypothetical protein